MKEVDTRKVFARRELMGAGVVGAAYLVLPEACGSVAPRSVDAGPGDAAADSAPPDTSIADAQPEATLVEGGGDCKQDDWTRPISIMSAGIALRGTAYAFTDDRFLDLTLQGNRILVINPLTRPGYVAMSGVCTHEGCSPFYLAKCLYSVPDGGTPQCAVPDSDAGKEGGTEAGQEDAGAETGMPDRESDAGSDDASDADIDADENEMPLTDILFCPCHQSVYNAITGVPLLGPATLTGSLQILETCVDDGYVFVTIPRNPGAP